MTVYLNRSTDFSSAELRDVVDGKSEQLAVGHALTLLVGQRYVGNASILEKFIGDRNRSAQLRALAVRLFVSLAPRDVEPVLLRALTDRDDVVVRQAIRALGRLGGVTALEPLQRIAETSDNRLLQQAKLAALTLAARHFVPGPTFSDWPCGGSLPIADGCGEEANIRPVRRIDFDEAIEAFTDDPLDVSFEKNSTLFIEGLNLEWLLLTNMGGFRGLSSATATVLLGTLAEWDPSDDRWFEGYLLFADAMNEDGTRALAMVDTSGEIVMAGQMSKCCDDWRFDLTTCSTTMLQARMAGTLTRNGFQLSNMVYRLSLSGRKKSTLIAAFS